MSNLRYDDCPSCTWSNVLDKDSGICKRCSYDRNAIAKPVLPETTDCFSCGEEFTKEFLILSEHGYICSDCLMDEEEADNEVDDEFTVAIKHDETKLRYDLIPADVMEAYAKVLTFGANKYTARNWEKGFDYSRVFGALQRHIWAWWSGEDLDPESGMSHLNHALFNVGALIYFDVNYRGTDDRP